MRNASALGVRGSTLVRFALTSRATHGFRCSKFLLRSIPTVFGLRTKAVGVLNELQRTRGMQSDLASLPDFAASLAVLGAPMSGERSRTSTAGGPNADFIAPSPHLPPGAPTPRRSLATWPRWTLVIRVH